MVGLEAALKVKNIFMERVFALYIDPLTNKTNYFRFKISVLCKDSDSIVEFSAKRAP